MKSAFAEWFVAQHGQRNKTYLSDRELHHAIEAGKAAERQLADRELWDQKEQSALYAWAASPQPQPVSKPDHHEQDLDMVAQHEARLAWIEQKLFVSRWNGVIDSGAQTTWQIAPDWRHTVAKMVGHKFGEAIDAAIAAQEKPE